VARASPHPRRRWSLGHRGSGLPHPWWRHPPRSPTTGNGILVGFLVTFQNEPNGIFWSIRSGKTQLGRAGSDRVDIGINDASSSSKHASINADPATGQAYVQDDGSRNGTFLNEQKLNPNEQRQLHDNDRLRLGSTTLVVKLLVS
jgi:pSer/pThr/pTyr-binding forkhead associated (FHA) protein